MKKLLLTFAVLMISVSVFPQKSYEIQAKLDRIIARTTVHVGAINMGAPVTHRIERLLIKEHNLFIKEQGDAKVIYMLPTKPCYTCGCTNCGYQEAQGACSWFPSSCNGAWCPGCGQFALRVFVASCDGSPCNGYMSFNK